MPLFLGILTIILPFSFFCIDRSFTKSSASRRMVQMIILTIVTYGLYVGTVQMIDKNYHDTLYSFDTNKDNGFSPDEESLPGYREAADNWTNDTGRNFAPFVGVPLSIMWVTISYGLFVAVSSGVKLVRTRRKKKAFIKR